MDEYFTMVERELREFDNTNEAKEQDKELA